MARWKANSSTIPEFENLEARLLLSGSTPQDALLPDLTKQEEAGIIQPIGEFHVDYEQVKQGSPLVGMDAIGFIGDTVPFQALGDVAPRGTAYMFTDNFGGTWYDAEKELPDSSSTPGSGDDYYCWAAAASNILQWTGWGITGGMANADQMLQYYVDHWTDYGGYMEYAWDWWFDGSNPSQGWSGWAQVDVAGGNFYPSQTFGNYFHKDSTDSAAMATIDQYLHAGYGTTIGIFGPGGHAITVWGYNYDPANPSTYYGLWVTDSDDNKNTNDRTTAPNVMHYYDVAYSNGRWYLQNYYGSNAWYIGEVQALAKKPGGGANVAPTLTTISTLTGAGKDAPFTISYDMLAAAANEADANGDSITFRVESVTSGTLTKDGVAIAPGSTLLSYGQNLVWTPAAGATGVLNAFTVKAYDGQAASASAVQVKVDVQTLTVNTFVSTDVPKAINDFQTVTSNLTVAGVALPITDVDVSLSLTHTWDADLRVTLIAPDGTRVQLFSGVGGSGDNFTNTILDDEAGTGISSGSAPFTGRFRPSNPLSVLDGKAANGTWKLEIYDGYGADTGTLTAWSLAITTVGNNAPLLTPIADKTMSHAQDTLVVPIVATDSDGDPLIYSAALRGVDPALVSLSLVGTQLTINPVANYVGSFFVDVSVSDGQATTTGSFRTTVTNAAPVLPAIADQTMSHTQANLVVNLGATDADGDAITYAAAFASADNAYDVKTQLGLVAYLPQYDNFMGLGEKYFQPADGGNLYHIRPSGDIFRYINGAYTAVAHVDPSYCGNPLALLNAQPSTPPTPQQVSMSIVGGQLIIDPAANYAGSFMVNVTASDGIATTSRSFKVTVTNAAPTLAAIADQTMSHAQNTLVVALSGADADSDPLTYSAVLRGADPALVSLSISGNQLTINPVANYTGSFFVDVAATDGMAAAVRSFQTTVTNAAPVLPAIADQTMSHTQDTLVINLGATDADGDAITYAASLALADNAFQVKQQLGLAAYLPQYDNYMGLGEKYFQPADGGNLYHIRPSGDIYRFMNGAYTVVAHVDPSYCTTPAALINAQPSNPPDPSQVSLSIVGGQLIINPAANYSGSFMVNVTATDGIATATRSFKTTVTNTAPVLPAIADQTMPHTQDILTVNLNATDADGDAITYIATIDAGAGGAFQVKQQLGLVAYLPQYDNYMGLGEKYFQPADGGNLYHIRSNGNIYRYISGAYTAVATVDTSFHTNPLSLLNAQPANPPDPSQVALSIVGNQLRINPAASYTGQFTINVTASDGASTVSRSFGVNVTNTAPTLAIADQTMSHNQANLVLALAATDADGDVITYTATIDPGSGAAFQVKQQLGLVAYLPQYDNYMGLGEKYFQPADGGNLYHIRANGNIYRYINGAYTSVANVDPAFHANPVSLVNLQPSTPPDPSQVSLTVVGNQIIIDPAASYAGQFAINVTASDGAGTVSDSFSVNVTNTAPTLVIADQMIASGEDKLVLTLPAVDADGDAVAYTATVAPGNNAFQIRQQLGLTAYLPQYNNYMGLGEKYFTPADGGSWYHIRATGDIYRYINGAYTVVAHVDPSYYADPQSLLNAQPSNPPDPSLVSISVVGNQLTIDPIASYVGQFAINVTASDGASTVSRSFNVTVTNASGFCAA